MTEPASRFGATPAFDQLYDCARRLGTCEVVIERASPSARGPRLAVLVRTCDDGTALHRAWVRSNVEEAANRIHAELGLPGHA